MRCAEDIMDEDGVGEREASEVYEEEREDWLDYESTDKRPASLSGNGG